MKRLISSIASIILCSVCLGAGAPSWAPAGTTIRTRWAADVNPSAPLPEYPRPQMVRSQWQNLNGLWNYAITDEGAGSFTSEGQILVPFCVESSLSGVGRTVGRQKALWYERTFTVPKNWKGKNVLLHFGAVDWKTDVWVNGVHMGQHTGGYTPFSYDITSALKKSGKQTLRVRVWDATDNSYQPRGKQIEQPRGIWYTPVTGIWQTVWMEPVNPAAHIENYYIVSDRKGNLKVEVSAEGALPTDEIKVELIEGWQGYSAEAPGSKVIASGEGAKCEIAVPDAKFWSPSDPYLYGVKLSIVRAGKVIDSVDGYTAIRTSQMVSDKVPDNRHNGYKRIGLNGKRIFAYGPLDQGWWPDGLYTAPTDEALRFDIEKTRDFGYNMIRKHIKVEPARWYYWCDVLGIMVWQDMPCIGDHGKRDYYRDAQIEKNVRNVWAGDSFVGGTDCVIPQEWKDNYYKEWKEIIAAVKNFQCITVWIPFNEAWGQFDTPEVVKFTRQQDPTRLINESSGGNFSFSGDIIDVHHYACPAMNAFDRKFINVLGEYGGLGLPLKGHLWQEDKNWGYGKTLESGKEVLDIYTQFADMLKVFITTGCSAAVYTQTTDVEIEVNGLMTYDREIIKLDEEALRKVNQSVINTLK